MKFWFVWRGDPSLSWMFGGDGAEREREAGSNAATDHATGSDTEEDRET